MENEEIINENVEDAISNEVDTPKPTFTPQELLLKHSAEGYMTSIKKANQEKMRKRIGQLNTHFTGYPTLPTDAGLIIGGHLSMLEEWTEEDQKQLENAEGFNVDSLFDSNPHSIDGCILRALAQASAVETLKIIKHNQ